MELFQAKVIPTPADWQPCTHESAARPGDGSTPPGAAHWGMATSPWCRTAGRSAAARHTRCNHSAPGARNRVLPERRPVRRGSCAAGGPFPQATWSPARSSRGNRVRIRKKESAVAACGFFDCCNSSRRYQVGTDPDSALKAVYQTAPANPCCPRRNPRLMLRKISQTQ